MSAIIDSKCGCKCFIPKSIDILRDDKHTAFLRLIQLMVLPLQPYLVSFYRLLHSTLSAFKESRERSLGHGAFLSLVDGKPRDELDESCVDIDMTMDIVKDFSDEIFSNIEQLNRNSVLGTTTDTTNSEKQCTAAIIHIEDETCRYTKSDTLTRDNIASYDEITGLKDKSKEEDGDVTGCLIENKTLLERRRVSLPEVTTLPNIRAIRIR